jgi:hypothetical protein
MPGWVRSVLVQRHLFLERMVASTAVAGMGECLSRAGDLLPYIQSNFASHGG